MSKESEQIKNRRKKLDRLRELGNPFPNDFRRNFFAQDLLNQYAENPKILLNHAILVKVAGRLISRRVMGNVSFVHIQDMTGKIQLFLQRNHLSEGVYAAFKQYDIGDIIGVEGSLFHTKTNELSVRVHWIRLLSKSLRPLPEKFHGLTDKEICYRQRYVDLIINEQSTNIFKVRAAAIQFIRSFFVDRHFLEVETPMMHPIPGGAVARPFKTYHNALDMHLFLRISPELYLKKLVVGGLERVFEINRNFRNEGVSTRHNPEFTTLEFYLAYANYHDLIELNEEMLEALFTSVLGTTRVDYQGEKIDFAKPYHQLTMLDAIRNYNPNIDPTLFSHVSAMKKICAKLCIPIKDSFGLGKMQMEVFEKTVQSKLISPTFITAYPVEVSPLSRRNEVNGHTSDRFEFFVAGKEIANGFSELNDSEEQADRFRTQVEEKEAGNDSAMHYDADYIRALEYGMPPTAGEGIGIDRLVMLMTNSPSIKDVVLFPHMRLEG